MLFPSPSDFSNILMSVQKLLSSAVFLFSARISWSQGVYSEYKCKQNAVSFNMLRALLHETKNITIPSPLPNVRIVLLPVRQSHAKVSKILSQLS